MTQKIRLKHVLKKAILENKTMIKNTFLCLALVSFGAFSAPELKGTPEELKQYFHPEERTIRLSDKAEKTAYTDEAIISLVVTTKEKLLASSIKKNTDLQAVIRQFLQQQGVKAANIKNAKFASSPDYGWFGDKPDKFEVINSMSIRINDADHLRVIATLADKYDQVSLDRTRFEHSKKLEFEQIVKKMALDKVMAQKAFYETNLNIQLTPIAFYDSSFRAEPIRQDLALRSRAKAESKMMSVSHYSKAAQPENESFDEIKYSANITVEFKITAL